MYNASVRRRAPEQRQYGDAERFDGVEAVGCNFSYPKVHSLFTWNVPVAQAFKPDSVVKGGFHAK